MAKSERTVVKKVENAVLYSDGTVRLDKVRIKYPHVFEVFAPKDKPDQTKKYSIVAFMPKTTHKAAKDLLLEIRNDFYKQHNKGAKLKPELVFLRDGDAEGSDADFAGCWTVNASETKRPAVRGPDKSVWTKEEHDDRIYSGCVCTIVIRPWWMDNKWGKRVNAGLNVVQFIADGTPLDDRISNEDAADDLESYDDGGAGGAYDDATDDL